MEIINDPKKVKAKKEHTCDFCGYKIKVGERYESTTLKNDDIYSWKSHEKCSEIAKRLKMYQNCGSEGLTADDFQDIITNEYFGIILNDFTLHNSILEELDYVSFDRRLHVVIHHYAKIDKENQQLNIK